MLVIIFVTGIVLLLMLYHSLPATFLIPLIFLFCLLLYLYLKKNRHSHGGFLSIDYYAQNSPLKAVNPGLKLLGSVVLIVFCVFADSLIICLLLILSSLLLTVMLGKVPLAYYLSLLAVPLSFIVLSAMAVLLEFSSSAFGYIDIPLFGFYICVSPLGQSLALHLTGKAFAGLSCLYMLSLSTPLADIIDMLRKLRLPSVLIELMYLIYRYIFVLLDIQHSLSLAAASRLAYRTRRSTLRASLLIAKSLMQQSFRKATAHYDAMESRCYDGSLRFISEKKGLRLLDVLIVGGYCVGLLFLYLLTR